MSQKLSLVKFEIEDEIPIDETSKNIESTYIPDEFVEYLAERNFSKEIDIKESSGLAPDIPSVFIVDIESAINEVEKRLSECVKDSYNAVCGELLIKKDLDNSYRDLLIWLKLRELFKLKSEKHIEDPHFMLVVG
ncbi:hypothetical protein [Pseudoalteromonas piscicida]|uniref:hypothetical protein n=1 Tax=Pseudoalteromonas piscicida TaxID=43662 RepID=UPI001C946BDC|nr:hypothetical protein [Pseudoalteromonas piscicida]QZO12799.1 hypothetical protein K5642_17300 [Pseudoalteromonas piscicida]